MRRTKEILQQMGFNPDAPVTTQNAFLRHLTKAAKDSLPLSTPQPKVGEQLAFDLDGPDSTVLPVSKAVVP